MWRKNSEGQRPHRSPSKSQDLLPNICGCDFFGQGDESTNMSKIPSNSHSPVSSDLTLRVPCLVVRYGPYHIVIPLPLLPTKPILT